MVRFEDLDAWKRSARLSAELYEFFQASKHYGFRDQITRSGLSILSYTTEGTEAGHINKTQGAIWVHETLQLSKMTFALIKYTTPT